MIIMSCSLVWVNSQAYYMMSQVGLAVLKYLYAGLKIAGCQWPKAGKNKLNSKVKKYDKRNSTDILYFICI